MHLRNFMFSKLNDDCLMDDLPINTRSLDAPSVKVGFPNLELFKKSVQYYIIGLLNGTVCLSIYEM